jgi:hypothetical protein
MLNGAAICSLSPRNEKFRLLAAAPLSLLGLLLSCP